MNHNNNMKNLIEYVIKMHNHDYKDVYQGMDWWYDENDNVRINIHNFGTKSRYRFKVDLYIDTCTWITVKTFDIRDYRRKNAVQRQRKTKRVRS